MDSTSTTFDPTFLWFFLLLPLLFLPMMRANVTGPGRALQKKFVAMGNLKGRKMNQVISTVGRPQSVSQMADGQLLQWMATGYHICLHFDHAGVCTGITHQSAH